jgi:hypothetical protein
MPFNAWHDVQFGPRIAAWRRNKFIKQKRHLVASQSMTFADNNMAGLHTGLCLHGWVTWDWGDEPPPGMQAGVGTDRRDEDSGGHCHLIQGVPFG